MSNSSSAQLSLSQAVAEIENLPEVFQQAVQPFLWKCGDGPFILLPIAEIDSLLSCRLFDRCPPTCGLISQFKAVDIIDNCVKFGFAPPLHTTKQKLSAWCAENAASCFFSFFLSPSFKKARDNTYRYLKRKFDWDYTVHEKYPFGSSQPDLFFSFSVDSANSVNSSWHSDRKYYFPDDEITQLLTLYGHNRCLNGFTAIPLDDIDQ